MNPRSRCGSRTDEPGTARERSLWRHRSHPLVCRILPHSPIIPPWCKRTSQPQLFSKEVSGYRPWPQQPCLLDLYHCPSSSTPPLITLSLPPCLQLPHQSPTLLPLALSLPTLRPHPWIWIWWQQLPRYSANKPLQSKTNLMIRKSSHPQNRLRHSHDWQYTLHAVLATIIANFLLFFMQFYHFNFFFFTHSLHVVTQTSLRHTKFLVLC